MIMNRTLIIIGAIVVVVVGGGVTWFAIGRNSGADNQQNSSATSQTSQNQQSNTGSANQSESPRTISALRLAGENRKITFSSTLEDGSQSNGTIYVDADKRMRGDFDLIKDGTTTKSSMIIRDDTQYLWQPSTNQGTKMSIDAMLDQNSDGVARDNQASSGADTNTPVDFTCSSWRVDDAIFTPPTNITFTDMTSVLR